jgi:hypothetical protein
MAKAKRYKVAVTIGHVVVEFRPATCEHMMYRRVDDGACLAVTVSLGRGLAVKNTSGVCGGLNSSHLAAQNVATQQLGGVHQSLVGEPPVKISSMYAAPVPGGIQKDVLKAKPTADHCASNKTFASIVEKACRADGKLKGTCRNAMCGSGHAGPSWKKAFKRAAKDAAESKKLASSGTFAPGIKMTSAPCVPR